MRKLRKLWVLLLLAAMALIFGYARYVEPELLIVREITVETDMDIEECRAVFFSDTHFGILYEETHAGQIVDRINALEADIVIFGGDLLDNYGRDAEMLDLDYLKKELGRIEAREGKFAVFGNHDYGGGAYRIYKDFMNECGFKVLVNETVVLEKYKIELTGFDDYLLGDTEPDSYRIESSQFHLIAAHEPVIAKLVEGAGDNFVLTGHTHGGQVSVPYLTRKLIPTGSNQFVKGFYTGTEIGARGLMQMYVTSGIGLTQYPFRFCNIPEIIAVNFVQKQTLAESGDKELKPVYK